MPAADSAQTFIAKWRKASGSERANYQLFIGGLCELLGVASPEPAREDTRDNAYVFERRVRFAHGDGSDSLGFIDCYKRAPWPRCSPPAPPPSLSPISPRTSPSAARGGAVCRRSSIRLSLLAVRPRAARRFTQFDRGKSA